MDNLAQLIKQQDILFEDLVIQLQKDLNLSGIDPDYFDGVVSPDMLLQRTENFIAEMISSYPEAFNRFMYRIDVPEKELAQINHRVLGDLTTHLTQLILKREIQKIVFRKQFGA